MAAHDCHIQRDQGEGFRVSNGEGADTRLSPTCRGIRGKGSGFLSVSERTLSCLPHSEGSEARVQGLYR